MRRSLIAAASTAVLLVSSAGVAQAQKPLGFERFTVADVATGVDFGLTELEVFEKYAAELPLVGSPNRPIHGQKDKRLIDIEVRPDGSGLAVYVYDVVWVQNTGSFQLDSGSCPTSTAAGEVAGEPAGHRDPRHRAVSARLVMAILGDPAAQHRQHALKLLLDTSIHSLVEAMNPPGPPPYFRPVDIDVTTVTVKDKQIFDAVLIQRVGVNNVVYAAPLLLHAEHWEMFNNGIHQLVDQELAGGIGALGTYLDIFIDSGLSFTVFYDLTQQQVEDAHFDVGRVVDLEGRVAINPLQSNEMRYYTVHMNH